MTSAATKKQQRSHNRSQGVLDAGAMLFATRGYKATTMRDIAAAVGMQPGSLYYHFASKQELLQAIYEIAVEQAIRRLDAAIEEQDDPQSTFESAIIAHTETMLHHDNYAQVMTGVLPADAPEIEAELTALRDGYEASFRRIIDDLKLPKGVDKKMLRLFVLGAINATRTWYRPGSLTPHQIGLQIVAILQAAI